MDAGMAEVGWGDRPCEQTVIRSESNMHIDAFLVMGVLAYIRSRSLTFVLYNLLGLQVRPSPSMRVLNGDSGVDQVR